MKILKKYIPTIFLTLFGALTLYLTISILLDLFGVRSKNIGYTPFVIWVNLFCGIAYLFAAYGFYTSKKWTSTLLGIALAVLLITFVVFNNYVSNGGVHKEDTFGALIFRMSFTTVFALIAKFTINKKQLQ